jgi:hypothetical protein
MPLNAAQASIDPTPNPRQIAALRKMFAHQPYQKDTKRSRCATHQQKSPKAGNNNRGGRFWSGRWRWRWQGFGSWIWHEMML